MIIKKIKNIFFRKEETAPKNKKLNKEELERKVVEGAKKAVEEYRGVFDRLAEYDRT